MQKNSLTNQLKNLQQSQQLLAIAILFLVVVFSWVFIEMFTEQQKSTISPALTKAALPLTPTLDLKTIDSLESKHYFSSDELASFPIYKFISTENGKESIIVPITVFAEDLVPPGEKNSSKPSSLTESVPEQKFQEPSDFSAPQIGVENP